jgi:hypothetical protein
VTKNETYYLERALSPPTAEGAPRVSHLRPTVVDEFGLAGVRFAKYRLVVLANLASLSAEEVLPLLEDYVRQGGGLLVFLGDRVDATFYNEQLFRNGQGLLPARLVAEKGTTGPDRKGVHLELTRPIYPPFARFTGEKAFFLNRSVLFYRYFGLALPERTEDLRVAARFEDEGPAIVEKLYGRGRVVLFASSCDAEWNNFAQRPAYLIVMHDLVSHLASAGAASRNLRVHEPYRRRFAPEELIHVVTVRPPGEGAAPKELRPYPLRKQERDGPETPPLSEIIFEETDAAGPYELELARKDGTRPVMEYLAVNSPPEESDLRCYTPDAVREAVPGLEFRYAAGVDDLAVAVKQSRQGSELARTLLLAVLGIACLELILGQRFGR